MAEGGRNGVVRFLCLHVMSFQKYVFYPTSYQGCEIVGDSRLIVQTLLIFSKNREKFYSILYFIYILLYLYSILQNNFLKFSCKHYTCGQKFQARRIMEFLYSLKILMTCTFQPEEASTSHYMVVTYMLCSVKKADENSETYFLL